MKKASAWLSILASLASSVLGLSLTYQVALGNYYSFSFPWISLGSKTLSFGFLLDPLSATLLFVVTIIGTLIQIYSVGYMKDDPRYSRFFAYLSLFMAAMLTLVISNNYLFFFMAWEVMGLCSYLLIGFWFEKNSAANAAQKAFITTRIGDIGFFLGILTLFVSIGTLNFADLERALATPHLSYLLPGAALLIFCGTIGKSAQFPLHVWLPDAMEGPTPVSALIHAATMVAAGIYLIARSFALFSLFPNVMHIVTLIGTITAMMAAFIALTETDIKKILAYSTISQLGYMVTALGLGGLSAGTFHLMTHAFFKALLFLGAGSVIHGTGVQDIRKMGGLFRDMKHTAITFIIASLAIAGAPPLSGFWSKDEILLTAYQSGNQNVYWLLFLTAFMTSFYMFRLVFLTFFGERRDHSIHAHESPPTMTLPLWILAIGAVFVGLPGSPLMHHWFQNFIHGTTFHETQGHETFNTFVVACSIAAGIGGILLAAVMYLRKSDLATSLSRVFRPLYELSFHKFWIDEIYMMFIIRPFKYLARILFRFDQTIVDGAVNGSAALTVRSSFIQLWFDKFIVDGLVNFTGHSMQLFSGILRHIQTGIVQHYMLIVFISVLLGVFFELRHY